MENTKIQKIGCPKCTGQMEYHTQDRLLVCSFCGYSMKQMAEDTGLEVSDPLLGTALHEYHGIKEREITNADLQEESADWGISMVEASCSACGAELLLKEGNVSTTCPYCDSNVMILSKSKEKMPMGIIPFQIEKSKIQEALQLPILHNILVPKEFKNQVDAEQFTPMYVPIWLFDLKVSIHFKGTYHQDKEETNGKFTKTYDGIGAPASKVYRDLVKDQISAYHLEKNVPFTPELVSGIIVQKQSLSMNEALLLAKERVEEMAKAEIVDKMGAKFHAKDCAVKELSVEYESSTVRHILVPLYFDTISYREKRYAQSVNGQTGIYYGDFPAKFREFSAYKQYV